MRMMTRAYGQARAKRIATRLSQLEAFDSLGEMAFFPASRPHELSGDKSGLVAVDIDEQFRMELAPDHDPVPAKPDGGLDWAQVTRIVVVRVGDYH